MASEREQRLEQALQEIVVDWIFCVGDKRAWGDRGEAYYNTAREALATPAADDPGELIHFVDQLSARVAALEEGAETEQSIESVFSEITEADMRAFIARMERAVAEPGPSGRCNVKCDRSWRVGSVYDERYCRNPDHHEPAPDPEAAEGEPIISRKDIEQWLLGMEKIESDPHTRLMYIYAAGVVRSEVKLRDRLRARVQPRRVSAEEFEALWRIGYEATPEFRGLTAFSRTGLKAVLERLGIEITPPEGGEDDETT